jgi:hypothetical protein
MASPTPAGEDIRRAWRLCCTLEGIDLRAPPALPLLFGLDAALGLPDGHRYELRCTPAAGAFCGSHVACPGGCASGCAGGDGDGGGCDGTERANEVRYPSGKPDT